ncbi:MAG: nonstructural protein [Microvirus sp.]|nr:MAG: nonstructural protein [Microvirus sp.]
MKKMLVSIKDVKTGEYLGLVQAVNVNDAQRSFMALCMEPKSPLYRFPRDYQLHNLGEFDNCTGDIDGLTKIEDLTPYEFVDGLVRRRDAAELADYKLDESMRASVDYFKNQGSRVKGDGSIIGA